MRIEHIEGKIFRATDGEMFGVIRALSDSIPADLQALQLIPFAEDSCGNFFVADGEQIRFWDHETLKVYLLAQSTAEFVAGLIEPESAVLQKSLVRSAWIDPEFAKKFGAS
jgi:hypothetical protein